MHTWHLVQATLLLTGSAALVWVSRKPLLLPGSHGFYRFFAWEAILALTVLNLPVWFRHPFSPAQVLSWLLLTGAAFLVIHAMWLLEQIGRAGSRAHSTAGADPVAGANYTFENTAQLVRTGAYRVIRHPMYASLLYLAWGVYLKQPASLTGIGLAATASVFLWLTARADEDESRRVFGTAYSEYAGQTKMFIPYVF